MSMAIKLGFCARKSVAGIGLALALWFPAAVLGQTNYYAASGTEYAIAGSMPGDQVHPDVAVNTNGGYVVWQDNVTDGNGWGISATRLDYPDLTPDFTWSDKKVNVHTGGDQENPRVALLHGGGAVFVWQGGQPSYQHIYARFLSPGGLWLTTNDVQVNTFTNNYQITPAVATLANGNVVVVWASSDEANSSSMLDVYGRIFSPTGAPVTDEFLINQFISYNQRTPAVAALADGGFVVAWVSEQERVVGAPNANAVPPSQQAYPSIDIYARLFDANGNPQSGHSSEFLVNADYNPCAHPSVAAGTDGGFVIAWDAHDMSSPNANSLDIYDCAFNSAGAVIGTVRRVNSYLYGDQYAPRISSLGTDYLIAWTSLAQDGSQQGVYGQFLRGDGSVVGGEFRVNTTTASSQIQPVVASDGDNQFLAVWTSYTGVPYSFDLFAQRYLNVNAALPAMAAPFVYAPFVLAGTNYEPQLVVSWAPVAGLSVSNYEVYVDGAAAPAVATTNNVWTMTAANGLTVSSSNYFQLDYVTTDGRRSPLSPPAGGTTWSGQNWGGIPYEWMTKYYGNLNVNFGDNGITYNWPSANASLVDNGPTLLQVFLSGGNPMNSATWLVTSLTKTSQGMILNWNTQPGFTYQVQMKTNLGGAWTNLDAPRFAAEPSDQINVGGTPAGYYRVLLLRQ